MTQKLQECVTELQALQAAQLLGEAVAEVVMQVVEPVVTTTPIPLEMDMDMAGAMQCLYRNLETDGEGNGFVH